MAKNRKFHSSRILNCTVASPTVSGDPIAVGDMAGIALTDYDSVSGKATVQFDGVFDVEVVASNASGNVAVAEGDAVYLSAAGVVSKNATGIFLGYAMEAIDSGETDTIMVRLADGGPSDNANALDGVFISSEQTGTGSSQNVAHGLGRAPTKVIVALTEFLSNQSVDVAEGSHDSTNVVVTVTSGVKFKVLAS